MKIKIDEKEILVSDPTKNIVEIGDDNGISITAPCFRNNRKHGCCKACVIEVNGVQKYACGLKPVDGMEIIYDRKDLAAIRKERLEKYAQAIKNNDTGNNSCCGSDSDGSSSCCSGTSCCD